MWIFFDRPVRLHAGDRRDRESRLRSRPSASTSSSSGGDTAETPGCIEEEFHGGTYGREARAKAQFDAQNRQIARQQSQGDALEVNTIQQQLDAARAAGGGRGAQAAPPANGDRAA